ncbi:MAG TPA: hypothetical protein VME47_06000 [Acetobacteraceae bacterium]|nr:hypothetical protein [Acetobacteraceae bacterium]
MNTAAAIKSDRAAQPELTRAWVRVSATSNAVAALVTLVFTLIGHGKHSSVPFRNHVREAACVLLGWCFGIATIGARMPRSAMRGVALYQVLRHHADRVLASALPAALRRDRTPPGRIGANARADTAAGDNTPANPMHPKTWQTCDLSHLPTQQPAADAARRDAACAILADIHLAPGRTGESAVAPWHRLLVPTARFGGSLMQSIAKVDRCKAPASRIEPPRFGGAPERQRPNCLSAEEQLRDLEPPQAKSAECSSPEAGPLTASCNAFRPTETAPTMRWPVSPHQAREVAAPALT